MEEKLITEQDLIDTGNKEKVDYLKSKKFEWKGCKFGNTLGGYIRGTVHISARSIASMPINELKNLV